VVIIYNKRDLFVILIYPDSEGCYLDKSILKIFMPVILIIGAVIIALGFGVLTYLSVTETDTPTSTSTEINVRTEDIEIINDTTPTGLTDPTPQASGDGTFRSTGEYLTPARTEHEVAVSLTLEGGIVTDSTVLFDGKALGQYSNDNQARFADVYKTEVVGKSLSEISLSRVGGASLTSRAFNEAVLKIAAETATDTTL